MKKLNKKQNKRKAQESITDFFIGIDWGERSSGLAIGDGILKIASAYGEVPTKNLVEEVLKLKKEEGRNWIILGIGVNFSKSKKDKIKKLERALKEKGLQVVFVNEDFSTVMAQKNLREKGIKNVSKKDNAESARIILQSWLDRDLLSS